MTYTTKISCNKSNLKYVRDFVSDVLEKYHISDIEVNLIVVAIDEVCSNLMIHSHGCNEDETLEVRIVNKGDTFVFEILDQDELFDIETCFDGVFYTVLRTVDLIEQCYQLFDKRKVY